jgi:hypothetical protein
LLLSALALLALGGTAAAKQTLSPNPANDRTLLGTKLDPNRYDGANGCVKHEPKGMKRLIKWMKANTKKNTIYGTIRCDGGVHGTGRALDWMLDARKNKQKQQAMRVINTWTAKDKRGNRNALARRMGVQLIIYNCKFWQAGDRGWDRYSACSGGKRKADPTQGHIDHIHVELTKPASKLRTSFWRSDLGAGGEVDPEDGGLGDGDGTGGGGNGTGNGGSGGGSDGGGVTASSKAGPPPPLHPPEQAAINAHLHL